MTLNNSQCVKARGALGLTKRKHVLHNDRILSGTAVRRNSHSKRHKAIWGSLGQLSFVVPGVDQSPVPRHRWNHEFQPELQPEQLQVPSIQEGRHKAGRGFPGLSVHGELAGYPSHFPPPH